MENRRSSDIDLDKGWAWVILVATFGAFVVIGGSCHTIGLVHTTLLDRYHDTITRTAAVGVAFTALGSLAGPLSAFISDHTSCRFSLMVSGVLYTVGYVATMFAPNIDACIITCGIISGFGAGIGYTVVFVVTSFSFSKRLVFAQAIASTGTGFGIFVMPPLLELAKEHYGSRGVFMMLSSFTAHLLVFAALMRPSELELKIKHSRNGNQKNKQTRQWVSLLKEYLSVCVDPPILCLSACLFFYCWATYTVFLYFHTFCRQEGSSDMEAAMLLSICGVLVIISRVVMAFLSSMSSFKNMYVFSGPMALLGVATALLPLYVHLYVGQVIYAVALGTCFGCPYVVLMALNKEYVGDRHMAAAIGIEYFFAGVAIIIGPITGGFILDYGGTYDVICIISGVCLLVATATGAMSGCVKGSLRTEPPLSIAITTDLLEDDKSKNILKSDVVDKLLSNEIKI